MHSIYRPKNQFGESTLLAHGYILSFMTTRNVPKVSCVLEKATALNCMKLSLVLSNLSFIYDRSYTIQIGIKLMVSY